MPITERCYPYMKPMAMSYLSRLTHLLQRDYPYIPDDWIAGWVSISREAGMSQDYAFDMGIPFSSTFELCSYLYPYIAEDGGNKNTLSHNEVHSKTMYEATINALTMFLTELQRY